MKTTTEDCGCKGTSKSATTQGKAHTVECQPCEIPALCRNYYYKGKLLTARDFADEQAYHSDKDRLHNLELHGWGVVCGFKVKPHPYCPKLRLVVEPGFAVDSCGREIRMSHSVEVALPQPEPKKPKEGCEDPDPAPPAQPPAPDPNAQTTHDVPVVANQADPQQQPYPTRDDDCGPVPIELYLCVRYVECETELSKAIFDECACPPKNMQPNRICEGAEIVLYTEKPKWWDDCHPKGCEHADCVDIFKEQLECPCPPPVPCIPLAVICDFTPGEEVHAEEIDNWTPRPRLVSTTLLDRAIHCILEKLPTKDLTKILDINWNHGDQYTCREFLADYVLGNHAKGFRIQFDSNVYSEAITTRTFQALIVFRPADRSRPHNMEIVPAKVETDPDTTEWCRLLIDPLYAKRALDEADFDVYVSLRCNVVTGKNGLAVDGNFLAVYPPDSPYRMEFPTGDNTPGGTFESWFSVRRSSKTT